MATDSLWEGTDADGIKSIISRKQWENHVVKRPEIANVLDLTIRAMMKPESIAPDRNRQDETKRYFRLLTISAQSVRRDYKLVISVKYVQQSNGEWLKFYQSCWFERKR